MRYINTVELKNRAHAILSEVQKGGLVIVTLRGKPCAAIRPIQEGDLEAYFEEKALADAVAEGLQDLDQGRSVSLKEYARGRFPTSR